MTAALKYSPWGLTPADVDLRRLLMQSDDYFALGRGYEDIPNPTDRRSTASYSELPAHPRATASPLRSDAARTRASAPGSTRASADAERRRGRHGRERRVAGRACSAARPALGIPSEADAAALLRDLRYRPPGRPIRAVPRSLANATDRVFSTKRPSGLPSPGTELRAFQWCQRFRAARRWNWRPPGARHGVAAVAVRSMRSQTARLEIWGRPDSTDGRASIDALMQTQVDVRSLLTTVNGARPIRRPGCRQPSCWTTRTKTDLAIRGLIAPVADDRCFAARAAPRSRRTRRRRSRRSTPSIRATSTPRALPRPIPPTRPPGNPRSSTPRRRAATTPLVRGRLGGTGGVSSGVPDSFANTTDALDVDNLNDPTVRALNLEVNGSGSTNQAINDAISNDVELAPLADFPARRSERTTVEARAGVRHRAAAVPHRGRVFRALHRCARRRAELLGDANHTNPPTPATCHAGHDRLRLPHRRRERGLHLRDHGVPAHQPVRGMHRADRLEHEPDFLYRVRRALSSRSRRSATTVRRSAARRSLRPGETKVFVAISPVSINQIEGPHPQQPAGQQFRREPQGQAQAAVRATDMQLVPVVGRTCARSRAPDDRLDRVRRPDGLHEHRQGHLRPALAARAKLWRPPGISGRTSSSTASASCRPT